MTALSIRCLSLATAAICSMTLASCRSNKKAGDLSGVVDYTTPNTGLSQSEYPFDEKGNYLTDVVSGKKKGSNNKATENPTAYPDTYEKPPEVAVVKTSTPNYETPPASDPYAPVFSSGSSNSGASSSSRPKTTSSTSSSKPKPSVSTTSSPKPRPKPKLVAKPKPAAKPKPSSVSYTVKKGDTLYSLANRYGTSVDAIKKASGLSSDVLRDGRNLKIPRK